MGSYSPFRLLKLTQHTCLYVTFIFFWLEGQREEGRGGEGGLDDGISCCECEHLV